MNLNEFLLAHNVPSQRDLVADPAHVGRFVWSDYWRSWDEILDCSINASGLSCWTVREVGEATIRVHSTPIPADAIFDAPRIVHGRHRRPLST